MRHWRKQMKIAGEFYFPLQMYFHTMNTLKRQSRCGKGHSTACQNHDIQIHLKRWHSACIRMGDHESAVEYYKKELELLREDWGLKYGAEVDALEEKIRALQ